MKQQQQQIFIRSPLTKTWQEVSCDLDRTTNPISQTETLSAYIHDTWGLQPADFFLVSHDTTATTTTKNPFDSETEQSCNTHNSGALFIELHITGLGGKGGFGSLLRGQTARAGQKKSNNTDACRDLNGRRLWQARAEKELAEWYQKQRAQETQNSTSTSIASSSRKRTDPIRPTNTTNTTDERGEGEGEGEGQFFNASQFREARDSTVSLIASSVQAAIKSGRAKQKNSLNESAPSKKRARLIGDVLPDLPAENSCPTESSDESSDQSDAHSTSTTKTSSTLATLDSSTTILTSATNRTRFTSASVATSGATNHSSITHGATFTHPSSITASTIATTTTATTTQQKSLPTDTTSRAVPQGAIAALAPSTVSLDSSATLVTEKEEANDHESTIVQVSSAVDQQQPQSSSQSQPEPQSESQSQSQSQSHSFAPINLAEYTSVDELIVFGADHLKWELQRLGLKCGGTCAERAQRLWMLRSCSIEKLDAKYFAKKPTHK